MTKDQHAHFFARTMYVISALALALSAFVVVVFLTWELFPANIISYPHGTTFPVITKTVKEGGYMQYQLDYCKYTQDISLVYQTLVGHNIYTLAPIQRNLPVGCQDRTITDVYIPPNVPPGDYVLHITVEYRPNPVRVVQYYVQTTSFTVTK